MRWRRGRLRGPAVSAESRWGLLAVLFGGLAVVAGAAAQVVGKDPGLRTLWTALLVLGGVVAVPGLVFQSPWWRERQRAAQRRRERRRADERILEASGRGVLRADWPGSFFTGRTRALAALVDFVSGTGADGAPAAGDRVRLVVGQPGSGKSAVLGRLMILTEPARGARAAGRIDGIVHARGKDTGQLVRALAEYAGAAHADPDLSGAALLEELLPALRDRRPPVTVVIDALDEAVEPERVVREVIRPLADSAPDIGIRLVLGLRRQLMSLLDVPATAVIDLDDSAYFDRDDLAAYASRCLTAGGGSRYRPDDPHTAAVAAAIAGQAGQVFLIAQLTARALAGDPRVVDLASPAWRRSFPSRVGTAMDALLARFGDSRRVRELLVPLAFAEGPGLPSGPLWATLAGALGTAAYTEQDVRWLLDATPAADLLQRVDLGAGDFRYRLFHEALAEHLRTRTAEPAPHETLTRALLAALGRTAAGEPDWRAAHPYVRAQLATHAARCGRLDELVLDPEFLLTAGPDPLLRALPAVRDRAARRAAAIYRGVIHQLRTLGSGEAAALLELHAREQSHPGLAARVAGTHRDRPWSATWVRARPVHPHQVVARHEGEVNTVVVVPVDGGLRVLCGDSAGVAGMWDVERGTRFGEPATAPGTEIAAVAVGRTPDGALVAVLGGDGGLWTSRLDGAPPRRIGAQTGIRCVAVAGPAGTVVAGDVDGRLGMYDLASGAGRGAVFEAHAAALRILVPGEVAGRPVVASGADDGSVAVWAVADGDPVASLPAAATEAVAALAFAPSPGDSAAPPAASPAGSAPLPATSAGGSAVLVVAGLDGVVREWDLAARRPLSTRVAAYDGWLNCLALAAFTRRPAVVGGAVDGRALIWRGLADGPETAVPDAALAGHDGWISSVTTVEHDGRELVVTGGLDGTVRAWDLADTDLLADRGDAHDGEVTAVSVLAGAGGPAVAVSGGTDGTVRLWRLADGTLAADPIPAHDQGVRTLATAPLAGRPFIASGGNDGSVRLWDGRTGRPLGAGLPAHARTVRALALLPVGDRLLLVSGGDDGVRRWDAASGAPIGGVLAAGADIRGVAATVRDGRALLVAGGADGLHRWDLLTGEPIGPALVTGRVDAVALGRVEGGLAVLAAVAGAGLRCWDPVTGAALGATVPADPPIRCLAATDTGTHPVAVAGDDHGLTVHALRGQRRARRVRLGFRAAAVAAVSSSDLLVGSWRGLYRLDLKEG